ncbi:GNAT family N-acetyltransferase [Christensenellaceae bacterium OttesenSCG-928-L17]|nr:GNAT family N-acetyltransferase [Christensenellaceae bacterium OttesenSCG-928-L17]
MPHTKCKECGCRIDYTPHANFILFCPACRQHAYLECEYGYGPVVPCRIFLGEEEIGLVTKEEAHHCLQTIYHSEKTKLTSTYLEALEEAIAIVTDLLKQEAPAAEAVVLREMLPEEGKALYKAALKSFSPVEAMGASVPKHAVVAAVSGEIAGSVFLTTFRGRNGQKIGYLNLGFIQKAYRGRGIGKQLYAYAVEKLKAEGCDVVTAMVKDDNVASWSLLERQGFSMIGLVALFRTFGFATGLLLWLKTLLCISCGMNFWVSETCKPAKSLSELFSFLSVNLGFILLYALLISKNTGRALSVSLPAGLIALVASILFGYIGTLLCGGTWRFGLTRGGLLISSAIMLSGSFFPLLGRWYPAVWENTAAQKTQLGIQAACEWGLLLLFYHITFFFMGGALQTSILQNLHGLLLFRVIAVFPFAHFGGARVWRWNKATFALFAAATLASIWLL